MKPKKEKKLHLSKETIQDLDIVLETNDQKKVNGGTGGVVLGTTQVPVYCKP